MHHPIDRIAHTTAFVTPMVEHWLEREIAQWVHPMKDRSDDPSHHVIEIMKVNQDEWEKKEMRVYYLREKWLSVYTLVSPRYKMNQMCYKFLNQICHWLGPAYILVNRSLQVELKHILF